MSKYIFRHYSILIVSCTFCALIVQGQDSLTRNYIDISKIALEKSLTNAVSYTYTSKNEDPEKIVSSLNFKPGLPHIGTVPNNYVTKKALLKFTVTNSADSAIPIFFTPGFYFTRIQLYKLSGISLQQLPVILPDIGDSIGFRGINLAKHDTLTIVAALTFLKTYNNVLKPKLINSRQLTAFIAEVHSNFRKSDIITYIFCGLLLMMILYSFSNFIQGANPEFFYYSCYALLLASLLFLQKLLHLKNSHFSFFVEAYFDFILQTAGIIFYMLFMRQFLTTKKKHPFLYKLYNASIIFLACIMITYSALHYFSDIYSLEYIVENITKITLLALIIVFLAYSSSHWDDKLLRYLFWGNFFLFIFALISQMGILMNQTFRNFPGIFSSSLFYYEVGLFLELVFFLGGLNYKTRSQLILQTKEREMLKSQNLLKEYEKEIAVYKAQQEERERISADMHDELGAGMTAIRLMSEIARNKMKENTPVEIDKISKSANDVLNKMNAIIWSMNSGNDTLDNLIYYLRSYALEYFDNTPIECKIQIPETIQPIELTGDKRRNIFLAVKEVLTNALKHSAASVIIIRISIDDKLLIQIADNGKGFDQQNIRQFGNGLKNINRRMESIHGLFTLKNDNGTVITLELPLSLLHP